MSVTRILVVEDELIVATDLENRLLLLGYQVAGPVRTGEQAVALASESRPDLVLMDIKLDGATDGITAAGQIYQDLRLPVIFLTAYSESTTLERAKLANPFGYILKPFEDRELKTTIEMALYKHQSDEEIFRLKRLYSTLSQVNQTIMRVRSREELFPVLTRIAIQFGQFKAARIDSIHPVTRQLIKMEHAGADLDPWFAVGQIGSESSVGVGAALTSALSGQPGLCNDLLKEAPVAVQSEWPGRFEVRSFATVPFRFGGEIFGLFSLAAGEPGFFQASEIKLLEEIALEISFSLDQFEETAKHKRAEAELKESERMKATLLGNLPGMAYRCRFDQDWTMEFVSQGCWPLSGYRSADLIGNKLISYSQLIHPQDRTLVEEAVKAALESRSQFQMSYRIITASGAEKWVWESGQGVFSEGGHVIALEGFIMDITERKRAEQEKEKLQIQLLQSQKMESVGRLAGGVAHDFNNMLQVILGNTSLALDDTPSSSPLRENLLEIRKAAQRSADFTRQLLAFARKQTVRPKILDLNDTVSGMLKMLQRLIGENIQLAWVPGPDLWPVKMDPSQLDQVLANLTVNARDAIDGIGKIIIETACITLDEDYAETHAEAVPGDYVMLSVSDTGCGMDEEIQSHLFEPFFTTKDVGEGTGLGLATVYGVIKQNGGLISVCSEPGRGATFKIYLPRAEAREVEAVMKAEKRTWRGTETVLLVEDERQILNLGQRILQQQGYTVLTAHLPEEAINLASQHSEPIHLLVTDVVMPGMNGRELREKVSALKPGLRCLFMSGYTTNVIAHQGILEKGINFLQKPFTVEALARSVRETLDIPL